MTRLSDDAMLHLGGYLVCHLADFRARVFPKTPVHIGRAADKLRSLILSLGALPVALDQLKAIRKAESILEDLDALLTRMIPNRTREFLLPLYEGRSPLLDSADASIRTFLELLCDYRSLPLEVCRQTIHDVRLILSDVAGLLLALETTVAPEHGTMRAAIGDEIESHLGRVEDVLLPCGGQELLARLRPASDYLLQAYLDTPYHRVAETIVADIVASRIAAVESDTQRHMLGRRLHLLQETDLLQPEPHVAPYIELLREFESWEAVEQLLLTDGLISELKAGI